MYSLGIDIGGTKCAAVLGKGEITGSTEGFILDRISFPTLVERGWQTVVAELISTADEILSRNSVEKNELVGIGISCGGPLDSKKGIINCPPNLPDWDGVPIVKIFEEHFGVKTRVQNDANACAVAEWKFGAGRGTENMIFLTFGTGMGAGLILDGRLYSGTTDLAGEVGHIRLADDGPVGFGKAGSFEGFCSGGGIARTAETMLSNYLAHGGTSSLSSADEISAKTVAIAAKNGDELAKSVYRECARRLGQALSLFIDILNPEAIVIGSIYSRDKELFDEIIKGVIAKEAIPLSASACRILPAELGNSIGDWAALGLCFD